MGETTSPSSSSQSLPQQTMEVVLHAPPLPENNNEEESSNIWDWGDLLDFTVDDNDLAINWDTSSSGPAQQQQQQLSPAQTEMILTPAATTTTTESSPDPGGRVRKRDPRMVCSNFLAGRVPCACPEMDEKLMELELEEEEVGHGGKKRARTVRAPPGVARCQVPSCGADIKELKGYHRRHRVCLRCANATTVVIDAETKRYCQQCGK